MKPTPSESKVQGEGDYASAEKYNKDTRDFVESGKVEQAAKDSAPRNAQEEAEMRKAEAAGREHAKGGQPGAKPDQDKDVAGQGAPNEQSPKEHPEGYNPSPKKVPGR